MDPLFAGGSMAYTLDVKLARCKLPRVWTWTHDMDDANTQSSRDVNALSEEMIGLGQTETPFARSSHTASKQDILGINV